MGNLYRDIYNVNYEAVNVIGFRYRMNHNRTYCAKRKKYTNDYQIQIVVVIK